MLIGCIYRKWYPNHEFSEEVYEYTIDDPTKIIPYKIKVWRSLVESTHFEESIYVQCMSLTTESK